MTDLPPTSGGSLYIAKQLSIPLVDSVAQAHWKFQHFPWTFQPAREVPEIGDVRTFECEFRGFGLVKTSETLRKYINTESYYEYEYHLTECTLLPGVEGYIGNVTVLSDTEHPDKSFVAYRASWTKGEVSDSFKKVCKGAVDSIGAPTPTAPHMPWMPTNSSSLYITKKLSVPPATAIANVHWKCQNAPWEFEPEREVTEFVDARPF